MAKQLIITPPMSVVYAYLVEPSTTYKPEGEYFVKVAIEDGTPEAEEFKAKLDALLDEFAPEATKNLKPAQKKKLVNASPYNYEEDEETGEETGRITFNFKCPAQVTSKKSGKTFNLKVDLFDSVGNPLAKDGLIIGSGSTIKVGFACDRAYCMEGKDQNNKPFHRVGLNMDLKAAQVLELATVSASAEDYGFGTEGGGFVQPKVESNMSPFDGPDDGEVPEGGDF